MRTLDAVRSAFLPFALRVLALASVLFVLAARPAHAQEPAPAGDESQAQWIAGWVVTGLGGAAFIAGTVTGALALHKHQQLAVLCPARTCEPPLHGDVDQFNALRMAATVSIAVAGAALVGGVTLLLTAPTAEEEPRTAARVRATLAPGALLVEGTF